MTEKPKALFICGSLNQTTQLHAVRRELGADVEARFSPFYGGVGVDLLRRFGLIERTIGGNFAWRRCLDYFAAHALPVDAGGRQGPYDLVVSCSDLVTPPNVRECTRVVVQEGILDPEGFAFAAVKRLPFLPAWFAGTAATGVRGDYDRFCVASRGYRDHFVSRGAPGARVIVTGIPNFDDCERFRRNGFPHHGYVLVCTSDARETLKRDDRLAFLASARRIAAGRPLIFKLHPNEDAERARREIAGVAPDALVFDSGSAEEMIANADVLVCQYSSTAFVGLALGKEVHSYWPIEELRRLLPEQNRSAARNIANVCRELLASGGRARHSSVVPSARALEQVA